MSRLRLDALRRQLEADNPVLQTEEKLYEECRAELRRSLDRHGWTVDQNGLTDELARLPEPETRDQAIEAVALGLLYEALVAKD